MQGTLVCAPRMRRTKISTIESSPLRKLILKMQSSYCKPSPVSSSQQLNVVNYDHPCFVSSPASRPAPSAVHTVICASSRLMAPLRAEPASIHQSGRSFPWTPNQGRGDPHICCLEGTGSQATLALGLYPPRHHHPTHDTPRGWRVGSRGVSTANHS